jgi:phenylalanyl-tRNA synthetase beta chain
VDEIMPTVTLSKKVVEEIIGKKLSLDELKDRISMLGTDLESVDKDEIHVEIFPNRPDLLSEQGLGRALASFVGKKTGLREYDVIRSDAKIVVDKSVEKVRPCSAAAIVKNITFTDELIREIMQNQEKLHITFGRNRKKVAIGFYLLDQVKFPVTYKAEDPKKIKFKPLHFKKELTGLQILSLHPAGTGFGHLLEGCDKFPVYVDADNKVLSMPPIINSDDVGNILPGTCDVLVECSGHDQETLNLALNMVVSSLADMGGELYSVEIEYHDSNFLGPDFTPRKMKISTSYTNKLLGLGLKDEDVGKLLGKMGFGYLIKTKEALIPAYRADILHPIDLVEDIAIAYGYENFEEQIPKVATIGKEDDFEIFKNRVADILVGLSLLETKGFNIVNKEDQFFKMNFKSAGVELSNALNIDFNILRSWIIPCLLKALSDNKHNVYPQNIFEIGHIFAKDKDDSTDTGIVENRRLGVALCSADVDFTKIKQVFDALCAALDVEYSINSEDHPSFIPGRVGRVSINNKKVAYIGEIHPKVLENFELETPVAAFELNLTDLYNIIKK